MLLDTCLGYGRTPVLGSEHRTRGTVKREGSRCLGWRVGSESQLRPVDMESKRTGKVLRERERWKHEEEKEQRVLEGL